MITPQEFIELQKPSIFNYILENENRDPAGFALKFRDSNLPARAIAEQIKCRKKASKKLPSLNFFRIFDSLALEQATGEIAAKYKSSFISGERGIDITGGMGADSHFLSQGFDEFVYCERNQFLKEIFDYNLTFSERENIKTFSDDGIKHLENNNSRFDWIYADPSRRQGDKRSVDINYYSPDIPANLDLLFSRADKICVKVAPAFDITEALRIFRRIDRITIISVGGEVKEVLIIMNSSLPDETIPMIEAVVLNKRKGESFLLTRLWSEKIGPVPTESMAEYLYEPDPAFVKSGLEGKLAVNFKLLRINETGVFFTSDELASGFPGRIFRIVDTLPFNEKEIRRWIKGKGIKKANLLRKDFPWSVEKLRKMFNIGEGGEEFLVFTSGPGREKVMFYCLRAD